MGTGDEMKSNGTTKTCSNKNCPESNPQFISNFVRNKSESDGFYHRCKSCRKIYLSENKEKISASTKEYGAEYRKQHISTANDRSTKYYEQNKEKVLKRNSARRSQRKILVDGISMNYGCCNPSCGWDKQFDPCLLDFHHFDKTSKELPVSLMYACKKSRVASEINKCVVLCSNCHRLYHAGNLELDESMLCRVSEDLEVLYE